MQKSLVNENKILNGWVQSANPVLETQSPLD
jgi:hypothetical protein